MEKQKPKTLCKKSISFLLALLLVLTAIPLSASAATMSYNCGEWEVQLDTAKKEISIWEYNGEENELEIPSQLDGYPVTSIERCFGDFTSVIIPDSVKRIKGAAFRGCTSLSSIDLPDSLVDIENSAFFNTAYYNDSANWEDGVLYIGKYLIDVNNRKAGSYAIKQGTICSADYAFENSRIHSVIIPDSMIIMGDSMFRDCIYLENIFIPDSVTSISSGVFGGCASLKSIALPDSVTSIGGGAFYGCTSLKSIALPDSVTSIGPQAFYDTGYFNTESNWEDGVLYCGNYLLAANKDAVLGEYNIKEGTKVIAGSAFSGCALLTGVHIPDSVTTICASAFRDSALTSITIPDSVTRIEQDSFYRCTSLTSAIIGSGVENIAYGAFLACSSLENIAISNNVKSIDALSFSGCSALSRVVIPDSVETIEGDAFRGCNALESISIGNGVTNIDSGAFDDCENIKEAYINSTCAFSILYASKSLKKVDIGNSVTSISNNVFENCTALTSVTIPNSVTNIGGEAFRNCTALTSITIPDSVTSIGREAFRGCTSLVSVTIGNGVTSIGSYAFENCTALTEISINSNYAVDVFKGNKSLQSVVLGDAVTRIPNFAFYDCTSLANVIIGDGVTSIGNSAFLNCTSLVNITIPHSVTSIGEWAFSGCTALTSITIPDSVTNIGYVAFDGCTALTIYGFSGSYAETYAKEWTIPFVALDAVRDTEQNITVIFPRDNLPDDGTTLVVQKLDITETSVTFDISLTNNDTPVQPTAPVTVKIPVPATMDGAKCKVYRQEADGTYTDMQAVLQDGYMVFTTDHFSVYMLTAKDPNASDIAMGDLNNDGQITAVDARWTLQVASGMRPLSDELIQIADVNGDGKITAVDARWILQAASGIRVL